jgi:hypothetical protein
VRKWAEQVGHQEAADLLQRQLRRKSRLTQIASMLNLEAVRTPGRPPKGWPRGRRMGTKESTRSLMNDKIRELVR